jgi:sucrose-6-phosphate hydrolase SacC (GH32 family)
MLWLFRLSLVALSGAWTTNCTNDGGATWGPCGPGREDCGPPFSDPATPQYHPRSASCGENDPNFSFYDPLHGLYHHFWQEHIAMPRNGEGGGPVIAHAVSADLAKWTRLPIAVWNDAPYDSRAIFTGSTTIVNMVPTMMYPGLCTQNSFPGCMGMDFSIAVPANRSDPLLTNWSKPSYNPILNASGDDPTTAWRTASGEWRMTRKDGRVFWSTDFVRWHPAACAQPGGCGPNGELFSQSECGDFFELPPACATDPGCTVGGPSPAPTHVRKVSLNGDFYTLGVYADGPPGSTGAWTPTHNTSAWVPLLQPLDASVRNDSRGYEVFAAVAKSFFDPSENRRVWFSWVKVLAPGAQSLAREARYHAALARLVFAPVPTMAGLRAAPPLFSAPALTVAAGGAVWLGDWDPGVGNQSEVAATFALPASGPPAVFGVQVNVGRGRTGGAGGANVSNTLRVVFDPATRAANASWGAVEAALPILPTDTEVDVHVFLDRAVAEIYVGKGRLAFTVAAGSAASSAEAGMVVFAEGQAVEARDIGAWHLNSCWVSKEEVLAGRKQRN